MAAYPCSDDPVEVIEKIVSAKTAAEKLDAVVNGGDTETVQLGTGDPTPTVRNAIRQMTADAAWAKAHIADAPEGDVSLNNATAWGATASRTLADRFSDVVNVLDYGAVGNGQADDTAAVAAAAEKAREKGASLWLAEKTCKITSWPANVRMHGGYIMFQGKLTRAGGAKCVEEPAVQKPMCKLRIVDASGERTFENSTWAAQGIAYLNVNGVDKVYMTVRTVHADDYYANQECRVAEFNLREDGAFTDLVQVTDNLPLGHGQGLGAQIDSDGEIWLYCMEGGVPDRYLSSGSNFGKGFTRVHYKGSSTQRSDCVSYRLLPFATAEETDFEKLALARFVTPTISPDGTKLVAMTANFVYVYDLASILACDTADVDYTWEDADDGSSNPIPDDPYVPLTSRIDATAVAPLQFWSRPSNRSVSSQGIACDSENIYISFGSGTLAKHHCIQVFSYDGVFKKEIYYSGALQLYTEDQIYGLDSSLQCLKTNENEGIFVKGDQLCVLSLVRWNDFGDIVTWNGKNYACLQDSTGAWPFLSADNNWQRTRHQANAGTFSPAVAYTGASREVPSMDTELRIITAVKPDDGGSMDVPLDKNGVLAFDGGSANHVIPLLPGGNFAVSYVSPFTGESKNKILVNDRNFQIFTAGGAGGFLNIFTNMTGIPDGYDEESGESLSNYAWIGLAGTGDAAKIRMYGGDDTGNPGNMQFVSKLGTHVAQIDSALRLRVGGSAGTSVSTSLSTNAHEDGVVFLPWATSTGLYFDTYDKNIIWRRLQDGELKTAVWLYRYSFAPTSDSPALALGSASVPWDHVYSSDGTIETSDARLKTDIETLPEAVFRAWGNIRVKVFRFITSVEEKGNAARLHVGIIAQEADEAFRAEGLDASRYGFFCHDSWEAQEAELDEEGKVAVPARPAGDKYSIRYTEALAIECAYQRWLGEKRDAEIETLKARLASLEG